MLRQCPRCQGQMESGFIVDRNHGHIMQSRWVAGEPKKGWFSEIALSQAGQGIKVTTMRCVQCGYLESYAPPVKES